MLSPEHIRLHIDRLMPVVQAHAKHGDGHIDGQNFRCACGEILWQVEKCSEQDLLDDEHLPAIERNFERYIGRS